jgi:hypothetical protein
MHIASTIQQVRETKSQNAVRVNAANKGTNNNANNSAAVAQSPRTRTDTVTLSKKSVALAAKTATKSEPKVEKAFNRQPDGEDFVHRLGVALVTKETVSQSLDNGTINNIGDAGEGSGNSNAVSSMSSLSNNIKNALESYKDVQKAENESKEAFGVLA